MNTFLAAFDNVPDPRADNARHGLCELLVVAFVAVFCGATSCAEMADFGRAKEQVFRGSLKLKHAIPSHDTFSTVFRMIDPKALDAVFGRVLIGIAAWLGDGDVIAIDGKALRGARDKGHSARTRMMVSAYAAQLRLTLATVAADHGGELEAAIEVLGLIALKGMDACFRGLHGPTVRAPWGIENAMHQQLYVSFREDAVRNRKDNGPANIAILRRRVLNLARRDNSKGSFSIKLKWAGWSDAFLLSLLRRLADT